MTMCDGCVAVLDGGKITVTIDTDRHAIKFLQGAGGFFQKASPSRLPARSVLLPPTVGRGRHRRPAPSRRAQNLLAGCIFDGLACQKCFCVTLDKSNRTEDEQVYEIGGVYNAKNDKRNGG